MEEALTSLKGQAWVGFAGNHYKEGKDNAHHCHPFKEGPDEGCQCADTPKTCIHGGFATSDSCLPNQLFVQHRTAASLSGNMILD